MEAKTQTTVRQNAAPVIMGLVRAAPVKAQRRLLVGGADLLTGGTFAAKAAAIRKEADAQVRAEVAKIEKATATEAAQAVKAKEEARKAAQAVREAAEAKEPQAVNTIKAARQAAGLAVVNSALAAYGEKPLPLVITLPNSPVAGLAARLNTQ